MSAGDLWQLPDGRKALELDGSSSHSLRVAPIKEHWPFPAPPERVARSKCVRLPSRYHQQQEAALW